MDNVAHDTRGKASQSDTAETRQDLENQERRIQDEIRRLKIEEKNIKKKVKALKKIESQQKKKNGGTSSDDTASAGYGNLLDGRADEALRAGSGRTGTSTFVPALPRTGAQSAVRHEAWYFANDAWEVASLSSTATASDLPGAGRTIGKLYSRAGKILERAMSQMAHRMGYGPYAVSLKVADLMQEEAIDCDPFDDGTVPIGFYHEWARLLKYIERGTPQTQDVGVTRLGSLMMALSEFVVNPKDSQFLYDALRSIWNGLNVTTSSHQSSLIHRDANNATQLRAGLVADWISVMINKEHEETLRMFYRLKWDLLKADYALRQWYSEIVDDHYGVLVDTFAVHFRPQTKQALDSYVLMSRDNPSLQSLELQRWVFEEVLCDGLPVLLRESIGRTLLLVRSNTVSGYNGTDKQAECNAPLSMQAMFQSVIYYADAYNLRHPTVVVLGKNVHDSELFEFRVEAIRSWGDFGLFPFRRFPRAVLTIQRRVEDVFIPDNEDESISETTHFETVNEEIIVADEYVHDLEIWRREVREVNRRRGSCLGRNGTFVKKVWELGVLPGRVVYAVLSDTESMFGPGPSYRLVEKPFGRLDPTRIAVML